MNTKTISTDLKIPCALEAEKYVIGSIILENQVAPDAFELLTEENFFDSKHKIIFKQMEDLYESGEPIDSISLYEELNKANKLNEAGGASYLSQLTMNISSPANLDYYARIILEKWIKRRLIVESNEIIKKASLQQEDVFDLLSYAEENIFSISTQIHKKSAMDVKDGFRELLNHIEAIKSGKNDYAISTGFYDVDEVIGGLKKSDLIILAARPSMGKSALALKVAKNVNIPVAFFSMEMSNIQLSSRLLAFETHYTPHDFLSGKIRNEDGADLLRIVSKYSNKIYIDDTPGLDPIRLRSKARRLKQQKDIGLVVVDYLQLMTAHADSREQEISKISRNLKSMAKELNVPVLALSQLNRAVESRSDKKPQLSDLRESGSIEQDADIVMFLYRPEVYGITMVDGESTENKAHVIISKHRNGPIGDKWVKFDKSRANFDNLERFERNYEPINSYHQKEELPI